MFAINTLVLTLSFAISSTHGHGVLTVPNLNGPGHARDPLFVESLRYVNPGVRDYYGSYPNTDMNAFKRDFGNTDLKELYTYKAINRGALNDRTNNSPQKAPRKAHFNRWIIDHQGPCAFYVVNKQGQSKKIFHEDDCVRKFCGHSNCESDIPLPTLPEDCGSDGCTLEFYWLTIGINNANGDNKDAQYYENKVALIGEGPGFAALDKAPSTPIGDIEDTASADAEEIIKSAEVEAAMLIAEAEATAAAIVKNAKNSPALTLYSECYFKGNKIELSAGRYNTEQLLRLVGEMNVRSIEIASDNVSYIMFQGNMDGSLTFKKESMECYKEFIQSKKIQSMEAMVFSN